MVWYYLSEINDDHTVDPGQIVVWQDGYVFQCPCNLRSVYVACPPHEPEFDEDGGLITLGGSCGWKKAGTLPKNWCHFSITDGEVVIHDDAKCPASETQKAGE